MEDLEKRVERLEELLSKMAQAISNFAKVVYEAIKYQQERLDNIENVVKILLEDYKMRKEFFRQNVL